MGGVFDKGSPDNVTQTTTQEPPEFLQPYLRNLAGAANQQFQQGPQPYYPGQTVVPFSQQTNQALNMQQNRAIGGSPLVSQAQSSIQNLMAGNSPLNAFLGGGADPYRSTEGTAPPITDMGYGGGPANGGDFILPGGFNAGSATSGPTGGIAGGGVVGPQFGGSQGFSATPNQGQPRGLASSSAPSQAAGGFPTSNPYLDATFDRAAGAVNRNLDTTLARSGRDLTGNMGARADQIGNLATNIYGGAYESDANRRLQAAQSLGQQQLQAAGQAIPLAREDYFDIGQLGQVGSTVEQQAGGIQQDRSGRFDFAQQAPWENINRFAGALSGAPYGQQGSSTQPVFNNPLSSALGGALGGGALANMLNLSGPWGAAAGGLIGLLDG